MPRKKSHLTLTDQFCGAGGSSQGARALAQQMKGGLEISVALNHWKLAIETHSTNFPDTLHDCTDVSACDPRRYPSTDILITSPECTNHSLAKGQKQVKAQLELYEKRLLDPAAERSRATMWDVPRFAEYHNYNLIIVENVWDARKWIQYPAWIHAMQLLGYDHRAVYLNSMFCHPTPQSRDRMYVVFWKKGNKPPQLDYTPAAFCGKCEKDVAAIQSWKNGKRWGVYGIKRGQYLYCCPYCTAIVHPYYYAAFNCIDWSDIGIRIGDREKNGLNPLSPNTIRRIEFGLEKYGSEPMIIQTRFGKEARGFARTVRDPVHTQTTIESHAFVVNDQQSTGIGFRVNGTDEKFPTISTQNHLKLITPFLLKSEHGTANGKNVRSIKEAMQCQTTRQSIGMITPFLVELKKQSTTRKLEQPISCMTTKPYHGLVTPGAFNSFLSYYNGNGANKHITESAPSVTTHDRLSVVTYHKPRLEDCHYRMLKPKEIKLAMAFDHDYIVLGTGKDQVKQLGNAVTPPAMQWLLQQAIKSLS